MELFLPNRKKHKQKKMGKSSPTGAPARLTEPKLLSEPQHKTMQAGKKVFLRVRASGEPAPEYQWLHNGVVLENTNSACIMIPSLSEENCGVYSCDIKNIAGITYSAKAFVRIWDGALPALEISFEESLPFRSGDTSTLIVSIKNFPEALSGYFLIHWFYDGKIIKKTYNESIDIPVNSARAGKYHAVIITSKGRVRTPVATWTPKNFNTLNNNQPFAESTAIKTPRKSKTENSLNDFLDDMSPEVIDANPTLQEKKKTFLEKFLTAWVQHTNTHAKEPAGKKSKPRSKKKEFLEKALAQFGSKKKKKKSHKKVA